MTRFFADWPIWQKLVFILACAIVVTVLLGCAKLGHIHLKLRRYTALAEKEKQEQRLQRQTSQRRIAPATEVNGEDALFGVRALDSGSPVEGIWYSRSNTPELSSRGTSKVSSEWSHVPRNGFSIDLEKQATVPLHDRSGSESSACTAFHDMVSSGSAVSPSQRRRSTLPPNIPDFKPPRSRYPPTTLSKFAGTPYLYRQDSASSTLSALESIYKASGPMAEHDCDGNPESGRSSNQSSSESTDIDSIASSAPKLLNHQPRLRVHSTDFEMMQNHRMSQAAETGQLTPRPRRPDSGGEWTSLQVTRRMSSASDAASPLGPDRPRSRSPEKDLTEQRTNGSPRLEAPKLDILPPVVRRSSLPDVTSFISFCQTAPLQPLPDDYEMCAEDRTPISSIQDTSPSYHATPKIESQFSTQPEQSPVESNQENAERSTFEHRTSEVIRGLGSGFEILAPGTLRPSLPAYRHTAKQRLAPPVSLHNNESRSRSCSEDGRRKLQKNRRESMDSQISDISQRSRASRI